MAELKLIALVVVGLALVGSITEAAELRRVPRILDVTYVWQASAPPNLVVRVKGEVPTAGWTEPYLIPRTYVKPPADGVWEYDFFMKPPAGVAAQVLTEVKTEHTTPGVTTKPKGLRIYGADAGVKEVKLK